MINTQINLIQKDCFKSCVNTSNLTELKNSELLITGGTGFIGKWISETIIYLNENHNFNIKLFLLARNIENFKLSVPHIAKKKYIYYLEQDIKNLYELPQSINFIINAAGSPDNIEHVSQPIKTIDTFIRGTYYLFEAAYRLPELKKILHISSHQIYGDVFIENHKIKESYNGSFNSYSINSVYGETKRMSETYCAIYKNQYRLPITIVRPFAIIGPYQSLNKPWAINSFIREALLNQPIRVLGNENTIRSYLYGSDVAFGLLTILCNGVIGEPYNLGSDEAISLKDLAKKISEKFKNNISIINKSSKEQYLKASVLVPDNTKVKTELNLTQIFFLDEALDRTIEWNNFEDNKK